MEDFDCFDLVASEGRKMEMFYLTTPFDFLLYSVVRVEKDHWDNERRNLHEPGSTYHSLCYTSWLEQEIAQWVHQMGSIWQPITPWVEALPLNYFSLTGCISCKTLISVMISLWLDYFPFHPLLHTWWDLLSWLGNMASFLCITHSSQSSMTSITNTIVCAILSVGWCI